MLSVSEVAVFIRVLSGLKARQHFMTRNEATSEWSYVAEKYCPATEDIGPGRPLPPGPPAPTRVAPGNHEQRLPGLYAPMATRV